MHLPIVELWQLIAKLQPVDARHCSKGQCSQAALQLQSYPSIPPCHATIYERKTLRRHVRTLDGAVEHTLYAVDDIKRRGGAIKLLAKRNRGSWQREGRHMITAFCFVRIKASLSYEAVKS